MSVELDGGVLRLTFLRPEVLNALSAAMAVTLAEQLERATADDDVRVVVITGSGGSFSAGADIGGEDAHERFDVRALDAANRIIRAEVACSKPVLAAVDGVAAGRRLLDRPGRRHHRGQRVGGVPARVRAGRADAGRRRVGHRRRVDRAGPGDADGAAGRAAHRPGGVRRRAGHPRRRRRGVPRPGRQADPPAGRRSPAAFAATKKAVNAATLDQLEAALERERTGQTILLRTEDAAEGMRAFSERRRPEFRGR